MIRPKDYLFEAIKNTPNKVAYISGEKSLTFLELHELVTKLAADFSNLGMKKGDYVVVSMNNSLIFEAVFFAVLANEAIIFSLPTDARPDELSGILAGFSASFAVFDTESLPFAEASYNKYCFQVLKIKLFGNRDYKLEVSEKNPNVVPKISPNEMYNKNFIYRSMSSGSSGFRKHIVRDDIGFDYEVQIVKRFYNLDSDDTFLNVAPASNHLCTAIMLLAMAYGCTLISEKKFLPFLVLSDIEKYRATVFTASPYIFDMTASYAKPNQYDLSSMRLALNVGAPLTEKIYDKVKNNLNINLHESYGSTETNIISSRLDDGIFKKGNVGRPVDGTDVKILDDNNNELPVGVVGNIAIASPGVIIDYIDNIEATKANFYGKYILIGDRGYLDQNSFLFLTGRASQTINVGGMKVDIAEIEDVLDSHPNVYESAVCGWNNGITNIVVAVVVKKTAINPEDLMKWCRDRLLPIKVPKKIVFIDSLPKDSVGKLNRKALLELF